MCVCVGWGADGLSKGVELGMWRKMRRAFSWSREFKQERMENQNGDLDRGQYGEGLGCHSTRESCPLRDAFC